MFNPQNIFHLKSDTNLKLHKFVEQNCFGIENNDSEEYPYALHNISKISRIVCDNQILTPKILSIGYAYSRYELINFQENIPKNHLDQLFESLRKLHDIQPEGFGLFDGEKDFAGTHGRWESYLLLNLGIHLDYLFENGLISSNENHDIFSKILGHCYNYQYTDMGSLLHGDLGPQNIKFYQDKLYLIDWDDALSGDPLYDLANWATFQWHSKDDEKYIFDFIKRFDHKSPDFVFWIYFLRISVMKMVVLHKNGFKDLSRAKNRILRALYG